jgi:hypothetical protein
MVVEMVVYSLNDIFIDLKIKRARFYNKLCFSLGLIFWIDLKFDIVSELKNGIVEIDLWSFALPLVNASFSKPVLFEGQVRLLVPILFSDVIFI